MSRLDAFEPPVTAPSVADDPADADGALRAGFRALGVFALLGVVASAAAVGSVAGGAILASWALDHLEGTRSHPAVTAVLLTALTAAIVFRAVPWARLHSLVARVATTDTERPARSAPSPFVTTSDEPGNAAEAEAAVPEVAPDTAGDDPTSAIPPARHRGARLRWPAIVVALALAQALVLHRSVLGHLSTRLLGIPGDRDWYLYVGWKIGQALRDGASPFQLEGLTSPHGYNLFVGDGFLPPLVSGVVNLFVGPVAAYNLMLIASTALSSVAGVHLASRLTDRRTVQLLSGVALATTPVVFVRLQGHFSLSFLFPLALVAAEAVTLARPGGRVRPVRLAAWMLLAFGCTVYYLLIGVGMLACALVVRLLAERSAWRTVLTRLVLAALAVGVVLSPFLVQRSRLTEAELDGGSFFNSSLTTDGEAYNADVLSGVIPTYPTAVDLPGTERFARNIVGISGEGNFSFPGLALLTLGVGGLVASRRREARAALAAAVGLWLVTLGPVADVYGVATVTDPAAPRPHWLPFEVLTKVPVLSTLRAPGRLSLGLPVLLLVGFALALDAVAKRIPRRAAGWQRAAPFALVALALVPNLPAFVPQPTAVDTPGARALFESLATRPGPEGRVVPVPSCVGELTGVESSLQIWHGLEQVGCQGPYLALPFASEMEDYRTSGDLAALRCVPNILGYVQAPYAPDHRVTSPGLTDLRAQFGVRYLVVDQTWVGRCAGLAELVTRLGAEHEVLPGDGRWSVIDLEASPA